MARLPAGYGSKLKRGMLVAVYSRSRADRHHGVIRYFGIYRGIHPDQRQQHLIGFYDKWAAVLPPKKKHPERVALSVCRRAIWTFHGPIVFRRRW